MADEEKQEAGPANILEEIIQDGKMALDKEQVPYAEDLISEFVEQVLAEGDTVSADAVSAINDRIAEIDDLLSAQLNEIMHHSEFQELEASWRGLSHLVFNTETGEMMKIRVLNASRADLQKDLEKAVEFDQSQLFKKLYEEEYGTFGGAPYGLLVGDFYFGRHAQDIAFLEKISNVAAAAHAPFIAGTSPKMFDMESFTELSTPRDLSKIFESAEMIKWRAFRDTEDSRYVALAMPRMLMRLPYGPETKPVEEVNFVESTDGYDHSSYAWGNAAYGLAQRITNSFSLHKWCTAIRGVENGGVVEGLPAHTFSTDEGDIALKCPTEIAITDRREKELDSMGFISLVHCKGTDYAAFFGGQTANKPKLYNTDSANANARLSGMLPYIMASSRFAHYLKVMMRDKVGSFASRENVETFLNRWIMGYVVDKDDVGQDLKAQYPLRDARVDVVEVPGKPGSYKATVFLRPHFMLEELSTSLRLVAELPAPAGG